jgi:electron transfer flavoprotein beta subunit
MVGEYTPFGDLSEFAQTGVLWQGGNVKVVVLIKRVPDTASELQVAADGKSVATEGLKFVMSPYDEHAVELAMKLKESNGAEVVVLSAGPPEAKEILRAALAMGADSGILVDTGQSGELTGRGVARLLASALAGLGADLVVAGKQAVDDDAAQVPERVAELMGISHTSVITRFELNGTTASIDREVEGGQYTLEVPLPALFTTQKGINTPRYPTLPNIMKAKKKEIREIPAAQFGLAADSLSAQLTTESMTLPRQQRLCRVIEGDSEQRVKELVRVLHMDEKVL